MTFQMFSLLVHDVFFQQWMKQNAKEYFVLITNFLNNLITAYTENDYFNVFVNSQDRDPLCFSSSEIWSCFSYPRRKLLCSSHSWLCSSSANIHLPDFAININKWKQSAPLCVNSPRWASRRSWWASSAWWAPPAPWSCWGWSWRCQCRCYSPSRSSISTTLGELYIFLTEIV